MELKDFYTTAELAKVLGISRVAVFKKIKNGLIKAQKIGRNFVIFKKDIGGLEVLLSELFRLAKNWIIANKKISEEFYCQNSGIFQARLVKMEGLMIKDKKAKNLFSLLTSIAGEIGNNSYDHNLGQWPDIPGIFFGYDLSKKQIILADKGVGVLETLKIVKPELKNHKDALVTAFTEIISGRRPEARGNGLKYVKSVISQNPINLIFQTGDAKLTLKSGDADLNIEITKENISGCLALITY
ncbi:helix-turn-helix domain-containing protein [Candidatus Wolfebacteria bacterium]|nr:helix-turn-helix domain-containing protein [Candidatus Wolfebacteria bacterium]